jgi:hypothetical protein
LGGCFPVVLHHQQHWTGVVLQAVGQSAVHLVPLPPLVVVLQAVDLPAGVRHHHQLLVAVVLHAVDLSQGWPW